MCVLGGEGVSFENVNVKLEVLHGQCIHNIFIFLKQGVRSPFDDACSLNLNNALYLPILQVFIINRVTQ